jgi:lysophospholipid acyltransferase (LPLAT)-like uncharacterized protein
MLKDFFRSPAGIKLLGRLLGWYGRFCGATTLWTFIGRDILHETGAAGGPVILCFWHNRMLLVRRGWEPWRKKQTLRILASNSRDGDIISEAIDTVGLQAVRGSSEKAGKSKGAIAAFREMLAHLHKGGAIGITPDGPGGPRMRAQMGAIQLAARTGAPIICYAWSKRGRFVANSWDKHIVPYPFGTGVFIWAGPLHVARNADDAALEAARLELETLLNTISDDADRRAGVALIEPDPPA